MRTDGTVLSKRPTPMPSCPLANGRGTRRRRSLPQRPKRERGENHPPAPDALTLAAQERFAAVPRTVISLLEAEPNNPLARSLARFARTLVGGLLECQAGTETALDKNHNSGARLVGARVT